MLVAHHNRASAAETKIATWNLDWLTTRATGDPALPADVQTRNAGDFARLHAYADHLAADVVAFEEVDGIQAASRVFDPATYTLLTIDEDVVQQVGLAVRHGIAVTRNPDVTALDTEPDAPHRLRNGLDATLTLPGGQRLRLLAVHLKTGCQRDRLATTHRAQCARLARQIPPLAAWVAARQAEGVPFLVLGDFNRELDRPEELGAALAQAAPLTRITEGHADPCWGGDAFIDHIFVGGPARGWVEPGSLRVMTYKETDPAWKDRLSDHCAVSARLAPPP